MPSPAVNRLPEFLLWSSLVHGLALAWPYTDLPSTMMPGHPVQVRLLPGGNAPAGPGTPAASPEVPAPATPREQPVSVTAPVAAPVAVRADAVPGARPAASRALVTRREPAPPVAAPLSKDSLAPGTATVDAMDPADSRSAGAAGPVDGWPVPPASADTARVVRPDLALLLHRAILEHRRYPYLARRQGQEGTASVDFLLHPDGHVSGLEIVRSSGHRQLDRAARRSVEAASPFDMARDYLREPRSFTVDIEFRLRG